MSRSRTCAVSTSRRCVARWQHQVTAGCALSPVRGTCCSPCGLPYPGRRDGRSRRRNRAALEKNRNSRPANTEAVPLTEAFDQRRRDLLPGTVLTREWNGRHHRVMVVGEGFAWEGRTYDSLSKIASAITGTKWNGPRFFGLRDRKPAEVHAMTVAVKSGPLRDLYPGFDRFRTRPGVQLAGCPI